MLFLTTNIILVLIIVFLFLVLSMVWPPDSPWAPWWRTNKETARAACRLARIKRNETVYELGSGDGQFLITAAKEFGAKAIGIEIDPLRVFVSSMLLRSNRLSDQIKIVRKNFFDVDISDADVVFVYLVPKALERLRPKLEKELTKRTRIVSYRYGMSLTLVKYDKKNEIYLYKI